MTSIPTTMSGVHLTGFGGLDKLQYREDIPTPLPGAEDALIRVTAAGMNNTDINTRTGWYNTSVKEGTTTDGGSRGFGVTEQGSGDWGVEFSFPRIQGADVVGEIAAVGDEVDPKRVGERVVCDPYIIDPQDPDGWLRAGFIGATCDGGFAQYCRIPARHVHRIEPSVELSDAQMATLPCSGGTAMNMLLMAQVTAGDVMLVTGASGGVGSFLVQIGKHLGASVVGVAHPSKHELLKRIGADALVDRDTSDLAGAARAAAGGDFSVVADVVGGSHFTDYLAVLRRGGRYVTAGAIAGPMVELDLRTLYLKSLSFFGSTIYRSDCFPTLMHIAARGGLNPLVDSEYPLADIARAQQAFMEKKHVGSLVLKPT